MCVLSCAPCLLRLYLPDIFVSGCGSVGLWVCRSVGLWVCRAVGLSGCRAVGLSGCGSVSLWVCLYRLSLVNGYVRVVCLFVCLFVYVCCMLSLCLCTCARVRVCACVCVEAPVLSCVYACLCVHACIAICMFVFVPVYAFLSKVKNGFPDFTIGPYLLRTLIVKFVVVVVVVVITFRLFLASQEEPKVIDTKELKVCRKRVRPLSSQTEMESRRLWQNVTAALKSKDIDSATAAKHLVSRSSKSLSCGQL